MQVRTMSYKKSVGRTQSAAEKGIHYINKLSSGVVYL